MESIAALVEYMEADLTRKMDLASLAEHAGYSKYHLHRMFASVVRFPVHEYLQRRRLTEAARLLVFSQRSIMDIALSTGYETQQSFTKAFKAYFRATPDRFRKRGEFYPLQLKYTVDGNTRLRGDEIMDVKVVQADRLLVAGYSANTGRGFSVIGKCWAKLERVKNRIENRVDMDTVIQLDDYGAGFDCGGQPAFDYYAAVEVSELSGLPSGMKAREIPAGKYVVFSYKGCPKDSMQPVIEYIYREWFPQSSARFDESNMIDFAKLGERLDENGKGDVEFWVPIL